MTATVKGTLFRKGQSWTGPWVTANGNGPLIVDVPPPDGEGVTTRGILEDRVRALRELAAPDATRELPAGEAEDAHATRDAAPATFLSYPL